MMETVARHHSVGMLEFTQRQKISLLLAHVAGMIDLVALPVWVGAALIGWYGFSPQQAGALATAYLISVVISSLLIAPRLRQIAPHRIVTLAFGGGALMCAVLAQQSSFFPMLGLHILIGLAVGVGLSATHGVIGQSANPHKLFAFVGIGLGVFGVVFMASMAGMLPKTGGPLLFYGFAATMLVASLAAVLMFPRVAVVPPQAQRAEQPRFPTAAGVWWVVAGISLMVLTQATMASFFERIGAARGFGETVLVILAVAGVVTIVAPMLAGLLQKKWSVRWVAFCGPLIQAALSAVIISSTGIAPFAVAVPLFIAILIFTHTFSFGWLARLDPSGSVTALTPAMLMAGSAVGPILGGVLVQQLGYWALGMACFLFSMLSAICSLIAARAERKRFDSVAASCATGS